jgi:hypothetical protein
MKAAAGQAIPQGGPRGTLTPHLIQPPIRHSGSATQRMTGVIAAGCSPADEYAETEYAALPVNRVSLCYGMYFVKATRSGLHTSCVIRIECGGFRISQAVSADLAVSAPDRWCHLGVADDDDSGRSPAGGEHRDGQYRLEMASAGGARLSPAVVHNGDELQACGSREENARFLK